MSSQESDKNTTGKIFPMDLASKPSAIKSVDTTGIIKVPQGTTTTYRTIGQPQMRVLSQVPSLGQTTASGAQIISTHIVPQAVLKQVDTTGRPQITSIPPRTPTTTQTLGQPIRTVVSTTYHVPRGAAAVANISGPRASLTSSIRASSQGITTPTSATQLSTSTNVGQSAIGVTVGVPVAGFVRAAAPQRTPSPATPSSWLQGNTVQVQTVQVSNPSSIVPQRIQTFTALGRPSHAIPNTRPAQGQIIHQAAQVHTFKPTVSGVAVQSLNTVLPVRTNQHQQGATLVYSNVSNPTQFTATPRLAMTTVPQRIGQTRQIQVAGTRARLQVPTGTRITAIPVTNATNVITAQPILTSNSHITLQTSATQPVNINTVNSNNRSIVNNVGITRPGQLLPSGTRINTNLATTNLVVQTNSSNSNINSNTSLGSANISTNIGTPNISGLVSLHPVLVTSGTPRTNHKIVAQIPQTGVLKSNSVASIQAVSVSNSNNSQATVGIVSNIGQIVPATRPVSIVGTTSVGPRVVTGGSKVFQPTSESGTGIFLHRASPGVITTTDQKSTASYTLPTSYYYEAPSYTTSGNYTNNIQTTHANRFNPIMVVEPSASQNVTETNSTAQSIVALSTMSNPPKLTSSPRPSILRKRDHDGSPLKAAKNLSATLNLHGSQFSPPERPDSEGHYAQSSGSTTMSATSSPGLEDEMDQSDDRKYSINDDDHKYPINIDIRKYPNDEQKYDSHYTNDDNKKYSGLNEENLRKFNLENTPEISYGFDDRFKTEERREGIRTNRDYNVLENRHKYMDKHDDKRINLSLIEGDVFKNDGNKNDIENSRIKILQEDERPVEVSPRKKPRKQQLTSNELLEPKYNTEDMQFLSDNKSNVEASISLSNDRQDRPKDITVRKPQPSLLSTYHPNWKPSHNHFQRHTDVKPKDERRPSIIDLANQSNVLQKVNGWKIYHLSSQMEDMAEQENQMHEDLKHLLGVYDGIKNRSDTELTTELLKGNMQRTQIVTDGLKESKVQVMRIFEHKDNVLDIITRCASKRNFKKRDK